MIQERSGLGQRGVNVVFFDTEKESVLAFIVKRKVIKDGTFSSLVLMYLVCFFKRL